MLAYKYLVWAVLLMSSAAGGWLAWWHFTKSLYVREEGSDMFGSAAIKPSVLLRRKLWRLVWTVAGTIGGLVVGMMALTTLTRYQG